MSKSPDAFRTISEVAEDIDVPQHVLRFWESKFSQIRPLKRGGGRRYYRPEDVDLLRGVRTLLYTDGYTVKGVQKVFREQGARYVIEAGKAEEAPVLVRRVVEDPEMRETVAENSVPHEDDVEQTPGPPPVRFAPQSMSGGSDADSSGTGLNAAAMDKLGDILDELELLRSEIDTARAKGADMMPGHSRSAAQ